ncbi:hypothetical protein [Sphingopyxis macrogoltabida]|uniref:Uncharacterized protein n=1 Tax=Sphingopyxis macrogoltabida TaxID=33050 RepID=A0AAC9AXI1_SPHMC|nr:hypothetical protein [Sphingopyxis macrogoltabida]AMU91859.1 hypothetical protein ATM17_22870 [Sphingopyxis macrogoltabida]
MSILWSFNFLWVLALCAAALRWGAAPERICAATLLGMTVGDRLYHILVGRNTIYGSVDIGHLIIDLLVAAIFTGVALRANRIYPLWLSAFQLVSVASHFARKASGKMSVIAYVLLNYAPYYCILLILTGGIWAHATRTKRYGAYRPWRNSSNPSRATEPRQRQAS